MYRLLRSYLHGRTFSVKCGQAVSASRPMASGVPQGSVLGPFLYLIYTHDFPSSASSTLAQLADDVAILKRDSSYPLAQEDLQLLLNEISSWCIKWRVKVNTTKSIVVPFTICRKSFEETMVLNGMPIPSSNCVRYLGVQLDSKLTWSEHIKQLVTKVRQRIRQLKHLLGTQSPLTLSTKRLLYLSLIRPIWTYSCELWGATAKSHLNKIQVTQNRVLRLITGAPWYVRNSTLHRDLHIPMVEHVVRNAYLALNTRMSDHANPLIAQIATQLPPHPSRRRLKRKLPQDFLIDDSTTTP